MDIFSLAGKIAIDYSDAVKGLEEVSKKASSTESSLSDVDGAADDAGSGLDGLGGSAADASDGLDDVGSAADDASGGIDSAGDSANSAGDDLEGLGGFADDAGSGLDGLGDSAEGADDKLSTLDVTVGQLVASGITSLASSLTGVVTDTVSAGDEIDKMSQKIGISTDAYQEWAYVFELCGTDISNLKTGMKTLSGVITDAANGSDTAAEKLEAVGLSIEDLDGLSQEQQFELVVSALQDMESGADRTTAATDLLGKSATDMAAIFNTSSEETDALRQQAHDLGIVLDEETISASATLNDSWTTLQDAASGLAARVATNILPSLTSLADWVTNNVIPAVEKLANNFDKIAPIITAVGTAVGILVVALNFSSIVSTLTGAFTGLSGVMTMLASPITAIAIVIGVLVAALMNLWNTNEEFRTAITDIWNGICTKVSEFINGIKERLEDLGITFNDTGGIIETLKNVWEEFCNFLAPIFEGVFQQISNILSAVLDTIMGLLDVFIGLFTGDWEQAWTGIKEIFGAVWDLLVSTFQNYLDVFTGIADTVLSWFGTSWEEVWGNIKTFFENIWNGIVSFVSTVLSNIKNAFSTAWNAIKTAVTTVINAISSVISTVFNAISSTISNVLNTIKNTVTTVWNAIKTAVTTVINAISSVISTVFNAIKSTISTVLNSIKSVFSTVFNAIKTTVSNAFNSIKTTISNGINAAKTTVSNVLDGIKSKFTSIFDNVKNTVKNAIDKIKGFFKFEVSLPSIKLPHFSISPSGWQLSDLLQGSIPSLGIEWYAKAMDDGMIMTQPTVFGYNAKNGNLLAGGEAGSETVVGTENLMEMIAAAANARNEELISKLETLIAYLAEYFPQILEAMEFDIVLDDDTLVARLAPKMNKELGKIATRKGRQKV